MDISALIAEIKVRRDSQIKPATCPRCGAWMMDGRFDSVAWHHRPETGTSDRSQTPCRFEDEKRRSRFYEIAAVALAESYAAGGSGDRSMTTSSAVRERPILFRADDEVRATLGGQQTQLRRVMRLPDGWEPDWEPLLAADGSCDVKWLSSPVPGVIKMGRTEWLKCPYGASGDHVWVREAWMPAFCLEPDNLLAPCIGWEDSMHGPLQAGAEGLLLFYRADYGRGEWPRLDSDDESKWRSPMHMPRWASRLTLEIVAVRVKREAGIWVWVVDFKRVQP